MSEKKICPFMYSEGEASAAYCYMETCMLFDCERRECCLLSLLKELVWLRRLLEALASRKQKE